MWKGSYILDFDSGHRVWGRVKGATRAAAEAALVAEIEETCTGKHKCFSAQVMTTSPEGEVVNKQHHWYFR